MYNSIITPCTVRSNRLQIASKFRIRPTKNRSSSRHWPNLCVAPSSSSQMTRRGQQERRIPSGQWQWKKASIGLVYHHHYHHTRLHDGVTWFNLNTWGRKRHWALATRVSLYDSHYLCLKRSYVSLRHSWCRHFPPNLCFADSHNTAKFETTTDVALFADYIIAGWYCKPDSLGAILTVLATQQFHAKFGANFVQIDSLVDSRYSGYLLSFDSYQLSNLRLKLWMLNVMCVSEAIGNIVSCT